MERPRINSLRMRISVDKMALLKYFYKSAGASGGCKPEPEEEEDVKLPTNKRGSYLRFDFLDCNIVLINYFLINFAGFFQERRLK